MDDPAPLHLPPASGPRRGSRLWLVLVIAAIAFAAGLALMLYASRNFPDWTVGATGVATTTAAQPAAAPSPVAPAPAAGTDPVTLATRETLLAAQIAGLEARAASLGQDAAAASGQATRAEAMLIAFAARRTIDRGLSLGYLEEQLRTRFGATQPAATLTVIRTARRPVTLEDLRAGLEALAPELTAGEGGWLAGVERELRSLVVLHRAGTPSPLPADRLARARRMLETGKVEAAVAEVSRMPGAALASNWLAAARGYVETHRALDMLEAAAILGRAAAPVVVPVPPVTPPAVQEQTTPAPTQDQAATPAI